MRVVSLAVALMLFWLLLSGHYTPFLIASGAVATIAIAIAGLSFGYADEEGHPIEMLGRSLLYLPWLIGEIVKSALGVAWVILQPELPIAPRIVRITPTQKGAVGTVAYANSITLTPGTITVEASRREHRLLVHALTKENADGLLEGEMDRRVTRMEGVG